MTETSSATSRGDTGTRSEATSETAGARIERVELRRLRLPLVSPFRTSFGTSTATRRAARARRHRRRDRLGRVRRGRRADLLLRVRRRRPARARASTCCRGCSRTRGERVTAARRRSAARGGQGPPDGQGRPGGGGPGRRAARRRAVRSPATSARSPTGCPSGCQRRHPPLGPALLDAVERLPRRGLPADQAQDRARLGRRAGAGRPRALRRRVLLQVDANTAYTPRRRAAPRAGSTTSACS